MLLCVGNFFSTSDPDPDTSSSTPVELLNEPPIPTYILGPTDEAQVKKYPDMSGGEIGASGIVYLGNTILLN